MKHTIRSSKHLKISGFDLSSRNETEVRAMFLAVPVRSLEGWMTYYTGKQQPGICKIIREVSNYRNGAADIPPGISEL